MTRIKGMTEIPTELVERGALHEIAIPRGDEILVYQDQAADELASAVDSGKAVVHPDYLEDIRMSNAHQFYSDKIVEERRSAHGVSFGRLVGRLPGTMKLGTVRNVAMKPFHGPEKAINEMRGYEILASLGIETFSAIGVFPAKGFDSVVVLTEKRDDFQSLDRDKWVVGRRVENEHDMEVAERNTRTVREISGVLALAHFNGVFLPDAQIKNFAITNYGRVGAIDTENLTTRDLLHSDTPTLAAENIEKLVKSLITEGAEATGEGIDKIFGVGMLARMSIGEARRSCEELIILPYVDALMELTSGDDVDLAKHEQAALLTEGIMRLLSQDQNWPNDLASGSGRSSGSGS